MQTNPTPGPRRSRAVPGTRSTGNALVRIHLLDAHADLLQATAALREDGRSGDIDLVLFDHFDRLCFDLKDFFAVLRQIVEPDPPNRDQ